MSERTIVEGLRDSARQRAAIAILSEPRLKAEDTYEWRAADLIAELEISNARLAGENEQLRAKAATLNSSLSSNIRYTDEIESALATTQKG